MVLPNMLSINQNLIIQQISAKMNYQIIKDKYIATIKNKQGLYIDLIEDEYKFINVYFPDDVWTRIKQYLFNQDIQDLIAKIIEIDHRKWVFKREMDLMTFNSQEWILQKEILWNTCKLRNVYQIKIKHLVRQDRPTHTNH